MKKVSLTQPHGTEKAIIDALLKISEIVQKTEASRQRSSNKRSKKTVGDGDYNESCDDEDQQQVPMPPPMRTLDSYVSGFDQQSLQKTSNCNQASRQYVLSHSQENKKQYDQPLGRQCSESNNYKDQERSYKRRCYDTSSTSLSSNDHHRKKSSCNNHPQLICQTFEKTENHPTITTFNSETTSYQINSAATTILDDQSSSVVTMPIASAAPIAVERQPSINSSPLHIEQQSWSSPNRLTSPKTDFDIFIDQQLQAALEKCLRSHSLPSTTAKHENTQRKTRLATLTKSETRKFINDSDFIQQTCNLEHYEKQRELAMLAAKQNNYSLSYSIYTNLLHDSQYDCKFKSEILASRATTLLLEEKCYESIADCTQAIAFNQWNKLAYIVRAACWMIKQEYSKAVEDYSKLFHFFDQSQHVLDLLNLAYEKYKCLNNDFEDEQSIKIEQDKEDIPPIKQPLTSAFGIPDNNPTNSLSLASPTASFIQPAVYLCYPYQAYPTWYTTNDEQDIQQPTYISEQRFQNLREIKSIHSNNNAIPSTIDSTSKTEHKKSQSNLIWIKNSSHLF